DLAVLLDIGPALRRELQQRRLAMPVRVHLQESLERLDPFRNAFRTVQPIDAEHEPASAETFAHESQHRRAPRIARKAHVRLRFDADRKGAEPDPPAVDLVAAAPLRPALPYEILGEIVAI